MPPGLNELIGSAMGINCVTKVTRFQSIELLMESVASVPIGLSNERFTVHYKPNGYISGLVR